MFDKIVLGSDGSECARNAATLAGEIAKRFDSETLVVNGFDLSFTAAGDIGAWAATVSPEVIGECMEAERESAENVVKPIFDALQTPYQMIQELGHPTGAILAVAEREKADLIVVGSRGMNRVEDLFLGSISHGVLHHAHCPVLIGRGSARPFQRILLASDGSEGAQKAAEAAFALAQRFDACLSVVSVSKPPHGALRDAADPHPAKTIKERLETERRYQAIEATVKPASEKTKVPYRICEEFGHPGEAIVRFAENGAFGPYDLIVMGSRGLGGFQRMLLGSVSSYVAYHSHGSVLIVR